MERLGLEGTSTMAWAGTSLHQAAGFCACSASAVELEALCVLSQLQSLQSHELRCALSAPKLGAGGSAPTQQLCTVSLKGETLGSGSVCDT